MLRQSVRSVYLKTFNRGFSITLTGNNSRKSSADVVKENDEQKSKQESKRMAEFRKKLRETTPIEDLGEQQSMSSADQNDPLPPWPNNTNPNTGEVGGPRGPEPTRYGDWERKGRVTDF